MNILGNPVRMHLLISTFYRHELLFTIRHWNSSLLWTPMTYLGTLGKMNLLASARSLSLAEGCCASRWWDVFLSGCLICVLRRNYFDGTHCLNDVSCICKGYMASQSFIYTNRI
jgi:hypothetical protein